MNTVHSLRIAGLLLAASMVAGPAHAVLSINGPWARPAPDGRNADFFVSLKSSEDAAITGVDSFAARSIAMRGKDGRKAVASIALPANATVELKPDAVHVRLTGLHRRLRYGEHVPVTLFVTSAGGLKQTIYVNAEVRKRSAAEDEMDPKGHDHGSHDHGGQEQDGHGGDAGPAGKPPHGAPGHRH